MSTNKSYKSALIFLTTLFFLWGFITVLVDSLVPRLKDVFEMSYARQYWFSLHFLQHFLLSQFLQELSCQKLDIEKELF